MTDVTSRVGVEFTSVGDAQVLRSLDQVAASGTKTEASLDSVAMANKRLAAEAQRAAGSSKVLQQAGLNLTRQFSDVGVSLASGISPMMVLIQQGPQVADAFQMAKSQGLGFSAVVKGLAASLAPMAPLLLVVGAAVGALVGAFALFEREIDAQTKRSTTFGDAWQATLNVIGKALMDGPVGDGLRWLGETFDATMNAIVDGVMGWLDRMVGFWGAAYLAITKNWRNLPQAIGAIMVGIVNQTITTVEGMINAVIGGINRLGSAVGMKELAEVALPRLRQASNAVASAFEEDQARIQAAFKASREKVFGAIVRETDRLAAAREKAKKAAKGHADETSKEAKALKELQQATERVLQSLETPFERAIREVAEAQITLRKALDAGIISVDQFRDAIARMFPVVVNARDAMKAANDEFERTPKDLAKAVEGIDTATDKANDLADAFGRVSFSISDMFRSIKSGDIGSLILNIQDMVGGIGTLAQGGLQGALSLGSIAASAIGGRTGRAVGGGLGIAASGVGLATALGSGGALAGIGAALGPAVVAAIGPIAIAAGALYAAAKLFNIGGKPSNKGAGFDLVTGAISGNKRDAETEEAARGAGEAILGIQDALRAAGIGLTETVNGLVIGTRDQTQIYLSSGKTLLSAVGDSGAAVDTALRAILTSATFVSEAQKKLVDSALAAGKGFDAVQEILAKYEAAQGITGALADQIKALTDPKGFDVAQVEKSIAQQRKDAAALAAEGFITADVLAIINGQLDTLRGLQLDEVLKRYTEAVEDAADTTLKVANDNAATAAGALSDAQQNLIEAYGREADALKQTADRFRALSASLREYGGTLAGGAGGAGGLQFARALFQRTAGLAAQGDVGALGSLQRVSEAYLQAAQAAAPDARAYARDLAAVRNAVESAASVADTEAAAATAQLEALHQQVAQLVTLNENVLTVADAIGALASATAANAAAQQALLDLQATAAPTTVAAPSSAPLAVDTTALQAEIVSLRTEVASLRAENAAQLADIQKTNATQAATLTRVTRDGEAMLTTQEAA